jgi:hypothetical protein
MALRLLVVLGTVLALVAPRGTPAALGEGGDTTPPAAPQITDPPEGTVVYASEITVRGIAEQGSTVLVFEGSSQLASATAGGDGFWTVVVPFADGLHSITARARDAAGNVGPSSAVRSFRVEAGAPPAPTLAIDDGGDGEITTAQAGAVVLSGTRSQGTSVEITVTALAGGSVFKQVPAGAGDYTATADLSALAFGRITATAVAVNPVGRRSVAVTDTSRLVPGGDGTVPPRVEIRDGDGIVSPAYDDLHAVPVDVTHLGPADTAPVTLDVTDGTTHVVVEMGTLTIDTPTRATADVSTLADGVVTATATVTSPDAVSGSDTTKLDRTPPRSSFGASSTSCVSLGLVAFSSCTMSGSATDATTGVLFVYVTGVNRDTGETFGKLAALDNAELKTVTWRLRGALLADLGPGRWTFAAHAQDTAGNFEDAPSSSADMLVL